MARPKPPKSTVANDIPQAGFIDPDEAEDLKRHLEEVQLIAAEDLKRYLEEVQVIADIADQVRYTVQAGFIDPDEAEDLKRYLEEVQSITAEQMEIQNLRSVAENLNGHLRNLMPLAKVGWVEKKRKAASAATKRGKLISSAKETHEVFERLRQQNPTLDKTPLVELTAAERDVSDRTVWDHLDIVDNLDGHC